MDITICENLKKYRKNKGNTQEQLAEYIGISIQAVSKWERNEGFPDITLLPKLAAYYNVSVDDLLGVGKIRQKEKIDEYWQRTKKENALEVWREAIREFPNDLTVIAEYMHHLPDDNEKDANEKIELAERLINESTEKENYTFSAIQNLCYTHMKLGNIEKAKEYANSLPIYYITQNQLMMSLLEGEEAVSYIQNNIIMLIDLFYLNVINMVRNKNFAWPKENIRVCEDTIKILELVYDGNLGKCYDWTFDLYFKIAENYATMNDLEKTLENLNTSAEHQIKWLMMPNGMNTSLFVNRHGYTSNRGFTGNVKWFLDEMQQEIFDFCRDDERFKAIAEKLSEYASKEE